MRPVQAWARKNRIEFFLPFLRPRDRILEIGSGEGWFRRVVEAAMPVDYLTIDIAAPADIRGDIHEWRQHGLHESSFDAIVAFEVVEHTDCFAEALQLLKPGGRLLVTTPMPHADWFLKALEALRLTQQRTSEHTNLLYLGTVREFAFEKRRNPFGLGQWAVLRKPIQ